MRTIDLRGVALIRENIAALIPRARTNSESISSQVSALLSEVRSSGEVALRAQTEKFDGVTGHLIRVPEHAIEASVDNLSAELRSAIAESISRVKKVCENQLPNSTSTSFGTGSTVRTRWQPIERVGLYVPGGKAVYPSSVVMNVVPAQIAGVTSIALVSPPQLVFQGQIHPTTLATAGMLGVTEIYAIGGAAAIGSLAFGVPELGLSKVDLITGPGNIWVATAKRLVRGSVGIDAEAGPTEILIIADDSANPEFVARDLVSQAEHDELACAVLVTNSVQLAESVEEQLPIICASTRHSDRICASLNGQQSAIVLVDDLDAAASFSNVYAPEHLELMVSNPEQLMSQIQSAGAIFFGEYSPVSLGDYLAGSNHVLPTGGQARFSAGLGIHTFLRPQQIIHYDRNGLEQVSRQLVAFANEEQLPGHGEAVASRFQNGFM
ncbi:MAG: histidinol dehydrogenase [Microbacteriaceae bacterium]|nr:histidinol dehydrogenase [Microbacteriaceae bacterium]